MVTTQLEAAIRTQEVIDVGEVLDFQWDTLFVFSPYTPQSQIKKKIGREIPESGIDVLDSFSLLVFMHQGKVVGFAEFERKFGDFTSAAEFDGISRAHAKFRKQVGPNHEVIFKKA